jgi:hypothetical protein
MMQYHRADGSEVELRMGGWKTGMAGDAIRPYLSAFNPNAIQALFSQTELSHQTVLVSGKNQARRQSASHEDSPLPRRSSIPVVPRSFRSPPLRGRSPSVSVGDFGLCPCEGLSHHVIARSEATKQSQNNFNQRRQQWVKRK